MNEYFIHESTSGTDARLMKLRAKYGSRYYGMYWLTLEWLYQNADAIGSYDITSLSFYLHEPEKDTEEFLEYCISTGLFINDNDGLYSLRLKEHKEKQIDKSEKARTNVLRRYNKRTYVGTTSRVKESRVEKSKVEQNISTSDKEIISENENEFRQAIPILSKILGSEKRFTPAALKKWSSRRLSFSADELLNAFSNLSNEPDLWKIKNNGFRSLEWWLHSDERIEEMKNCHLKQSSSKGNFIIAS